MEAIMRHRVYYLLPDIDSTRQAMDELLLSRIEARPIHFLQVTEIEKRLADRFPAMRFAGEEPNIPILP